MSEFENLRMSVFIPRLRGARGVYFAILLLLPFITQAQNKPTAPTNKIEANASINPKEINIGEAVQMKIVVKSPKGTEVFWPELQDKITTDSTHEVNITAQSKTDTLTADNVVTQSRTVTITAFDSGSYTIPPLVFGYRETSKDSIKQATTLPMLLMVNTLAIDTAQPIKPAKDQLDLPFSWKEIKNLIIAGGVITIALIALLIYLLTRKKSQHVVAAKEVRIPPHILAMQKLQAVEDGKYWQLGNTKKYYSEISDIVREYIEKRYRILALESTTYELMVKMNNTNIDSMDKLNLRELLELCDLVKFAKVEPMPDEHAKAIILAREFVKNTRVPDAPVAQNNLPQ